MLDMWFQNSFFMVSPVRDFSDASARSMRILESSPLQNPGSR